MRALVLIAYIMASIGAGAATFAEDDNSAAAFVAMAIWPMAIGYRLMKSP